MSCSSKCFIFFFLQFIFFNLVPLCSLFISFLWCFFDSVCAWTLQSHSSCGDSALCLCIASRSFSFYIFISPFGVFNDNVAETSSEVHFFLFLLFFLANIPACFLFRQCLSKRLITGSSMFSFDPVTG